VAFTQIMQVVREKFGLAKMVMVGTARDHQRRLAALNQAGDGTQLTSGPPQQCRLRRPTML
jgi:hypothetical protein